MALLIDIAWNRNERTKRAVDKILLILEDWLDNT